MYLDYFGLTEKPFSIAPDPQYLFMSGRHKEAMGHLSYGLSQGGCFVVLTGEVGTGKTTLCRNLLNDLPDNVDVALILNPNINELELLQTVCDELKVPYEDLFSQKQLLDRIYNHLLNKFSDNRNTVLIIDEAQLLKRDVLEQIRLLTNLETTKSKLLQIMLIGQPELNTLLSRNDLRQLAQRVTARYHLGALQKNEIGDYVNFRLSVAGCKKPLFTKQALSKLYALTEGIPRRINVLADHSLLSAYSKSQVLVDAKCVKKSSKEVFMQAEPDSSLPNKKLVWIGLGLALVLLNVLFWLWYTSNSTTDSSAVNQTPVQIPVQLIEQEKNELLSQNDLELSPALSIDEIDTNIKNEDTLTTITKSDEINPGSVVLSEELLDDEPLLVNPNPPIIEGLQYDYNSAFGKTLQASSDVSGRVAAFRALSEAWDVVLPKKILKPECEEVKSGGIRCSTVSSWAQLKRFNRPAILVLEQRNQLHRVIVFNIESSMAKVLIGENVVSVSTDELRSRWIKKGVILWRPLESQSTFFKQGDVNDQLPKVRLMMNKALSALSMPLLNDVESSNYDGDLAQKAFALQSRFNILMDGKIGIETYLLMNEVIAADITPTLTPRIQ